MSMKPSDLMLGVGLGLLAGYIDTSAFVGLYGLFTAHVTGNFVLIGSELARPSHAGVLPLKFLAIPAFAGSAAYGCAEAWRFREGLNEPVRRAPAFYTVLALCVIVGIAICFSPIDPIRALYWSAVLNGVAAVPMLVFVMLLSQKRDAAGQPGSGPVSKLLGWLAVALMAVSVMTMIVDVLT